MSVLVLAEHDGARLSAATCHALGAAAQLDTPIHVLLAAEKGASLAAELAALEGVAKVLLVEAPHYARATAENLAALLHRQAPAHTHILAAATVLGKQVVPRLAALLEVQPLSEVVRIVDAQAFVRPCHAGSLLTTLRGAAAPVLLTVRPSAFAALPPGASRAPVESLAALADKGQTRRLPRAAQAAASQDLTRARVVVCGGRGFASAERFKTLLEPLVAQLDAAIGATRAAVDAGYAANETQIGQTGRIVAPALYVGIGVSGAIQHMAGIKEAKTVVAINRDAEAPLCQQADYILVADLNEAVLQLTTALAVLKCPQA